MANEETVGLRIIEEAFKLPMVKVDRRAFLIQTFQGKEGYLTIIAVQSEFVN